MKKAVLTTGVIACVAGGIVIYRQNEKNKKFKKKFKRFEVHSGKIGTEPLESKSLESYCIGNLDNVLHKQNVSLGEVEIIEEYPKSVETNEIKESQKHQ